MQFASWKTSVRNGVVLASLFFNLTLGLGCAGTPYKAPPPPLRPWLLSKSKLPDESINAFGGRFIIRATTSAAAKAAVAELRRLGSLYDAKNGSELARINANAYHQAVTVTPETGALLGICQKMYEASNHKFDISFVAPDPEANPSDNAVTDWEHKDKLSAGIQHYLGKQNVLYDPDLKQVRVYIRRTKLNLNGMIRGYAVERATMAMQKAGATGGEILSDGMISVVGTELKNPSLLCIENPDRLGTCLFRITPLDSSRPLFLGISASKERKGAMFDPKDIWTYRSGGVTVAGNDGAWVQYAATLTALMDDGQLGSFIAKDSSPKVTAAFYDQNKKNSLKGSLLPFAKLSK